MIFPDPKHSPFSGEGDFHGQMLQYIRTHFAAFLGEDLKLLDRPNGLDLIQAKYPARPLDLPMELRAEYAAAVPQSHANKSHETKAVAAA